MKRMLLFSMTILIMLVLVGLTIVLAIPAQAANDKSRAPDLEKIEFIHWKKDFAKPETARVPKAPSCYKLMKVKLLDTVNFTVNPNNLQGLSPEFITSAISTAAETWDIETSKELIGTGTVDYSAIYGVLDGKNSISFGNYGQSGVIAVTSIWWNPATKAIAEFDMMFDNSWNWGDAEIDSAKMDLLNIATHEFGHAVGMDDIYDSSCSVVTMYGYSNYGDVIKRDLADPDRLGLIKKYGL